jgi:hypothetical protein
VAQVQARRDDDVDTRRNEAAERGDRERAHQFEPGHVAQHGEREQRERGRERRSRRYEALARDVDNEVGPERLAGLLTLPEPVEEQDAARCGMPKTAKSAAYEPKDIVPPPARVAMSPPPSASAADGRNGGDAPAAEECLQEQEDPDRGCDRDRDEPADRLPLRPRTSAWYSSGRASP